MSSRKKTRSSPKFLKIEEESLNESGFRWRKPYANTFFAVEQEMLNPACQRIKKKIWNPKDSLRCLEHMRR
jgi:hypothetical protein